MKVVGRLRTLRAHVKLGADQFLRPDMRPDIQILTKIQSVLSHTILVTTVKFHVNRSIFLAVLLSTDRQTHTQTDRQTPTSTITYAKSRRVMNHD